MAPNLNHTEIQELLGAFAIDAVEADEAAAVARHLTECPRCRAEVAEHREAAALLAFSGGESSDALWSRIAQSLDGAEPAPLLDFVGFARARRHRTPRVASVLGAAAAVLALLGLGTKVVRQDQRLDRLASASSQRQLDAVAAAAAVTPGARVVHLRAATGSAAVDAVVLAGGAGYLVDAHLPPLPAGQSYQLWGLTGGQAVSLGVLGYRPVTAAFRAAGPFHTLAITAERAGGAVAPTRAPVVSGPLTSS